MEKLSKMQLNADMIEQIKEVITRGRENVVYTVNNELLAAYWNVGRIIIENEQNGNIKAEYGKQMILLLSKELTKLLGKGFSRSNLFLMRSLYLKYPKIQTLSGKLSWSHYIELLSIDEDSKRSFYEKEAENSKWSVRMLEEQIGKSLYERLLLSDGKANKKKVMELATKGQIISKPEDMLKEPYIFEFLGVKENKPALEKELEKRLINHIEEFLLELGKGFMYVGSQQRIPVEMSNYHVDMVFYNKILKAYVLIDLKMTEMKPEYAGQMNMYLNYYETEVNEENDNKPIGIILCAGKKKVSIEYALGGLANNIYASSYTYYIPNQEQLAREVELALQSEEKDSEIN